MFENGKKLDGTTVCIGERTRPVPRVIPRAHAHLSSNTTFPTVSASKSASRWTARGLPPLFVVHSREDGQIILPRKDRLFSPDISRFSDQALQPVCGRAAVQK
jgi:hypothetical protein